MKIKTLSVRWFWLVLIAVNAFSAIGVAEAVKRSSNPQHLQIGPAFPARITMKDGTTRLVVFEGVGCTHEMCSRVLMRTEQDHEAAQIRLESISAIRSVNQDTALFVMKDGSERRLRLIPDFRVLYVTNSKGDSEKLDLGTIQGLDMLAPAN